MKSKAQQKISYWIIRALFIPVVLCFNIDEIAACAWGSWSPCAVKYRNPPDLNYYARRNEQWPIDISFRWPHVSSNLDVVYLVDTSGGGDDRRFRRVQSWAWAAWQYNNDTDFAYHVWYEKFDTNDIGVALLPSDEDPGQNVWIAAVKGGEVHTVRDVYGWRNRDDRQNSWQRVVQGNVTTLPWSNYNTFPAPSQVIHNGELRVIRPNRVMWHPTLRIPAIPSGEQAVYFGSWVSPTWNGGSNAWVVRSSMVPACTATLLNSLPTVNVSYSADCSRTQQPLLLVKNKHYKEVLPQMLTPTTGFGKGKSISTQQGSWEIPLR